MDTTLKSGIWSQLGATIDMLDTLWGNRIQPQEFWYVAYHALFWLDLFLFGAEEGFKPPVPCALMADAANRVRARNTLTLVREEEVLYWEYVMPQAAGRGGLASLADAYRRLQTAAMRIGDLAMRASFLDRAPLHRAVIQGYETRFG